ncbi:helix-turn-helix domain-containing protein [Actinacidiphila sp. ITFR-21]|uniref:helix-turn-helix domain-containing protein n=1 Tax=Actinacidiphila sp. ITFR-21 TaxID=3075199 RepID=UPI00288B08ED|nr:helix-turn-helix domain-containing protein [Streptomyces sp. ITFR-21]WNI19201.1 hypothetical protein RLT57_29100 [Streptomyces sp. ITFR-21]
MAAEVLGRDYTQVSNQLFRDARIHAKSKGIFGFLATHRDGFGVSPESIAAAMADGLSAVKSALRELEQYGYLTRSQVRGSDGLMGDTTYRITDMPSSEPADENLPPVPTSNDAQTRRSEPVDGNPPAVDPPAVNRPHKKTIPMKKISSEEKTTSSSVAEVSEAPTATAPEATDGGGGGSSSSRAIAEEIAAVLDYRGKLPDKRQRQLIADRLAAALDGGWSVDGLALYLDLGDAPVNSAAAVYAHRLRPDVLPEAEPAPSPVQLLDVTADDLFGPARPELPATMWGRAVQLAQSRLVGSGHRPFECPPASAYTNRGFGSGGGTDDRVAGWGQLARQFAAKEHKPYTNAGW